MTACPRYQDQLADGAYGTLDAGARRRFEAHLAGCPGCAAELRELRETVELLRREAPPRPSPGQLDGVWERLAPRLEATTPAPPGKVLSFPRRSWLALAAAAAMAAAVLGWTLLGPRAQRPGFDVPPEIAAAEVTLDDELGRYYARATPLLLSLSNRDPSRPAVDAGAERRAAQRLASEAGRLRGDLEAARRGRQLNLVNDLEIVFLQLANLREGEYRKGIELLQATLDQRAILFQLSVEELRRETPPIPKTTA
jgi:Putative zinc-finger